jgi:hypothetical protein
VKAFPFFVPPVQIHPAHMKHIPVRKPFANQLSQVIILLLIFLWAYASWSKLADHAKTAALLSKLFKKQTATVLSWAVPAVELFTACTLTVHSLKRAALWLSFSLLLIFTAYIIMVLGGGFEHYPCTCGGLLQSMSWRQHLAFNLTAMALHLPALYGLSRYPETRSRKEVTGIRT